MEEIDNNALWLIAEALSVLAKSQIPEWKPKRLNASGEQEFYNPITGEAEQ